MANKPVYLIWNPKDEFTLADDDSYQIVMKKPKGVKASDLLPMSLIGCVSYDVVEILQKQKQDLQELKVSAESEQDEDPPWAFRKIHLRFHAVGKGLNAEKVRKAITLSAEKYCSVYNTLKASVQISFEAEVKEPQP